MEDERNSRVHRTILYTLVVYFFWLIAKIFFFIRFEGMENVPKGKPCILMANHQAFVDPMTLALCARDRELHFMGKKELFENRFLNWAFTKMHGFPVDRGGTDLAAIRTAMNVLKDGESLGIFPEGTRSHTGHMLPILGGASLIALKSGCDIVPVYIEGRYRIFRPMRVHVGKPLEVADLRAGRINKESTEALTHRMEAAFMQLSGGKAGLPAPTESM